MSIKEVLRRVVEDVLERFAFMFMDTEDEQRLSDFSGEFRHVLITFNGEKRGALTITAPLSMCKVLAANVLGEDEDEVDESAGDDALSELANVVCGSLIPELFDNQVVYDLTVPRIYRIGSDKWRELAADQNAVAVWVDEQPLLFNLMTEG